MLESTPRKMAVSCLLFISIVYELALIELYLRCTIVLQPTANRYLAVSRSQARGIIELSVSGLTLRSARGGCACARARVSASHQSIGDL